MIQLGLLTVTLIRLQPVSAFSTFGPEPYIRSKSDAQCNGSEKIGAEYRSSNIIIQNILERIIKDPSDGGIVKSNLVRSCGLKASTAEKYLTKMETAGYIESVEEPWGERSRTRFRILPLGIERYSWFMRINAEMK